jgi:hypothetical protein
LAFSWSFLAKPAGTYRIPLIVNDGLVSSTVSEILIQAAASNGQSTAVIGGTRNRRSVRVRHP